MNHSVFASIASLFSMSDEQAMWRVRMHDDAQAFAQLMARWEGPIRGLCTRMLGDPHKGEDLAQDTFARLFSKRKEYQTSGRFSTFLWRMAVNICYDELRRRKRRPEAPLEEVAGPENDELPVLTVLEAAPDMQLLREERGQMVRQAVLRLSDAYRSVVILRHYENLKFREIAEVLGIPEGTVKSRMAEALTQLHGMLAHNFGDSNPGLCKTQNKPSMAERLVL
jgi:RNA polymerase sigma-70 factor, ECF subfamily